MLFTVDQKKIIVFLIEKADFQDRIKINKTENSFGYQNNLLNPDQEGF